MLRGRQEARPHSGHLRPRGQGNGRKDRFGMQMKLTFALVLLLVTLTGAAQAACRDDLVASAQDLQKSRSAVEGAAQGTPAQCAALRQHVATLTKIRTVFARCDTGTNKAKNAAQVGDSITVFTKRMRAS